MEKKQVIKADRWRLCRCPTASKKLFSILVFIPYCIDRVLGSCICVFILGNAAIQSHQCYTSQE